MPEEKEGSLNDLQARSVVDFLETDTPAVRVLKRLSSLNERRLYISGFAKGYFSFKEFLVLMLPLRLFPSKVNYLPREREFLELEAKDELRNFLSVDGAVNFLGHAFYMPNCLDGLRLISQVVLFDQYHAKEFIEKDSVVIDAGANIGPFSVFAAHLAPEGHVYVFEPTACTFSFLEKNGRGYSNLTCVKAGLGDETTEKKLLNKGVGNLGNTIEDSPLCKRWGSDKGTWEKITITTIDEFVSQNQVPRIDFLKIDTEGYEARILRGAAESIKKFRPLIAMSAYHNPEDKSELPKLLRSICPDYTCELCRNVEEDFICRPS